MPQRAAIAAADDQHAVGIGMREQRDVDQRLVVRELVVEAGLQRARENQAAPGPLQFEHLERLEGRRLLVDSGNDAVALLHPTERWLGEPLFQGAGPPIAYADNVAGVRDRRARCRWMRRGLLTASCGRSSCPRLISITP